MNPRRQCGITVRSVLYLLLVTCCTLVLAVQCWYLVLQYLEEPVAIDMDTILGVSEAPFPSLTVCDSNQFSRRVARAWGVLNTDGLTIDWNHFPWANRSVTEFWEEAAPPLNQLVTLCNDFDCRPKGARGGNTSKGNWIATWFRRGPCYTLHPLGIIIHNRERHLHLELHSDPGDSTLHGVNSKALTPSFHLFFHGAVTPIVDDDFDDVLLTMHQTMQAGEVSELRLTARQRRLQSLRRRPCDSSAGYSQPRCLVVCRWRELARANGCRPQWSDAFSLPLCSSKDDFLNMRTKNLWLPEEDRCLVRCPPACVTTLHQVKVAKLTVEENLRRMNKSIVKIIWPYAANRTSEQLTYTGSDLMSDLGGSLGLLFGLSLVSAVRLAEAAIHSLLSRCRHHHHVHSQKPAVPRPALNAKTIFTVNENKEWIV